MIKRGDEEMTLDEAIEQANKAMVAAMSVPTNTVCMDIEALDKIVEAAEHYNECYGD